MMAAGELQPAGHTMRKCAQALLVVCIGVRLGLVVSDAANPPWPDLTLSKVRDAHQLLSWCQEIALLIVLDAVQSLLLGALLVLSLSRPTAKANRPAILLSFLCGCGLSCLLKSIAAGGGLHEWDLMLTAGVTAIGVWLGAAVFRGWTGVLKLIPQSLMLLIMVGVVLMFAYEKLVSETPAIPPPQQMSWDDKQTLVQRLRRELAHAGPEQGQIRLQLSSTEVDALVNWGISDRKIPVAAGVRMRTGVVDLLVSMPVKVVVAGHLNVRLSLALESQASSLTWYVVEGRVGQVTLPAHVLNDMLRPVIGEVQLIPEIRTLLESMQTVLITEQGLVVEGRRDQLRQALLPLLRRGVQADDVQLSRIQAYCQQAVRVSSRLPEGDLKLARLMRAMFQLADQRSQTADPVQENRAALLALAYLIGNSPAASLIGPVMSADELQLAQRRLGRVTVRGREDLARHMLISCGLVLLSNEQFSATVGLWKERLDAESGSGFSFVDLLADRVGLRLAQRATSDRNSAETLQFRLREDWDPADLFPVITDLPEGIGQREFQQTYGDGTGEAFRRLEREIDRRIQNCRILR